MFYGVVSTEKKNEQGRGNHENVFSIVKTNDTQCFMILLPPSPRCGKKTWFINIHLSMTNAFLACLSRGPFSL